MSVLQISILLIIIVTLLVVTVVYADVAEKKINITGINTLFARYQIIIYQLFS